MNYIKFLFLLVTLYAQTSNKKVPILNYDPQIFIRFLGCLPISDAKRLTEFFSQTLKCTILFKKDSEQKGCLLKNMIKVLTLFQPVHKSLSAV